MLLSLILNNYAQLQNAKWYFGNQANSTFTSDFTLKHK